MYICLTGHILAGKGAVSEYLRSKGFAKFVYSDILREELKKRSLEINRDNLVSVANELRAEHGPSVLSKKIVEKIKRDGIQDAVIEGSRNPAEIQELKDSLNCAVLSIEAQREIRFKRMLSRNRDDDPKTFEEFIKVDERDLGKDQPSTGNQVQKCIDMADYHIENNGSLEDLHRKIDSLLIEFN